MHRPRVSVGLPVYNGERYLEQALRSLLSQTYTDFELIISDNASTDRTDALCRDYAARDSRIRYVRNDTNLGANPNFNRVLELATGDYFRWAAYDDLCLPTYLQTCVEALDADPDVVLAHTQTTIIDETGSPIDVSPEALTRRRIHPHELDDPPRRLDSPSPSRRYFDVLLHTHWCFEIFGLTRMSLIRPTGGMANFYGSDKVFLAILALEGPFKEVPQPLFQRRHHAEQSSMIDTPEGRAIWSGSAIPARALESQRQCLTGYIQALRGATKLGITQRLACWAIIGRYLLQLNKWSAALGLIPRRKIELAPQAPEQLLTTK